MRKPIEKYLIRVVMDQMDVLVQCLKNLKIASETFRS